MKKNLTAIAVASALFIPFAAQADGPTVYGKAHASYGAKETVVNGTTTVDNYQFRSHDSRIGFKGSRDFGDGLQAVYKFEFGINPDSDGADDDGITRRNMYIGLKGGFGELRLGRHDTPLKMAQGKFDQFGDTDGDFKNAGDEDGENRLDSILMYMGKFGDVGLNIAFAPGEDAPPSSTADDGPADTISAAVSYNAGPLYLALAHDSYENGASLANDSLTRLVGTYKFGGMQVGLLWQNGVEAADVAAAEEDWLGISFSAKIGKSNKIKAQYITVEDSATTALEGTQLTLGFDHMFDKATTGYVMYNKLEEEQGGTTTLEDSFLGVGMILKF